MNTIQIPKEEILDILECDDIKEIKEYATKHDCHATVYVLKKDDKYYKFTIEFSYNHGMQIFGDFVEAIEVKPVEKTVIDWIKV